MTTGAITVTRGMGGLDRFTLGIETSLGSTWMDWEMHCSLDASQGRFPKKGKGNIRYHSTAILENKAMGPKRSVKLHVQVYVASK